MKNLFKEAHEMTREIATKYEVDYQAQFGLVLSYLLENKEEEGEMLENLKGTEKQVKFANDIAKEVISMVEDLEESINVKAKSEKNRDKNLSKLDEVKNVLNRYEDAGSFINDFQHIFNHGREASDIAYMFNEGIKEKLGIKISLRYVNHVIDTRAMMEEQ